MAAESSIMAERSGLSEYCKRLAPKDREEYIQKLTLSNGVQLPDPYAITEWDYDRRKWPDLQWPDIHNYLIEKPSVYTKEKIRAYKSLDAYQFVLNGHVQGVKYHDIDGEFCVLASEVLPSQRQGHKTTMYDAWAVVNTRANYILTANCTCVAG